jgi:hypothetical protein
MDNDKLLELTRKASAQKVDTERFLTDYFKLQGKNQFKAAELAQGYVSNFVEYANEMIQSNSACNQCSLFVSVSKEIVVINTDYEKVLSIQKSLGELGWRDFEYLSSNILQVCFGAVEVKTTQSTGDGGVDFEGKLLLRDTIGGVTYGDIEVYGQSKRYAANVGIYDVKSFVAFANIKKRHFAHRPQIFMFFTTSYFAQSALDELKENGFIGLNGAQLAFLIFRYRERFGVPSIQYGNATGGKVQTSNI